MAVYAIGDVHGCFSELQTLLAELAFNAKRDQLIFVGDLLSRGPDSIGVMRFVRDSGDHAITVLGNHEVRALAGLSGYGSADFEKHMQFLAEAPDRDELFSWLRHQPLIHSNPELGFAVVHAGIHPFWSLEESCRRAELLQALIANVEEAPSLYAKLEMQPAQEEIPSMDAMDRLCFSLALFTRIRLCSQQGVLLWAQQARTAGLADPYDLPPVDFPFQPWYAVRPSTRGEKIVYGHWAMAGLTLNPTTFGLDSGCVYGGKLTAMRLDHPDNPIFQVSCRHYATVS